MPKKNKTVSIEPSIPHQLEVLIGYALGTWAEKLERLAPGGHEDRDQVNELLAELLPLLEARDAVIDAETTGELCRTVFAKYARELVQEVREELPTMNVPEGTLAYHAARATAAAAAERALDLIAA